MTEQRELIFHDTVPLPDEQLEKARDTAIRQRDCVLLYFRDRFSMNFTPVEVWHALNENPVTWGTVIMLNSVRRTITNLTKEGRLIKCDWSERRMGQYGKDNRTWRYNIEYIKPLNARR